MKKIVIASCIFIFILMVVFISTFLMEDATLSHDGGHIPDSIAAFNLVNKIEGAEAKQIMNQLFGKEVELDAAYAVEYQARKGSYALVWIAESNSEEKLTELFEGMNQMVAANNAYSNHSEKVISDQEVQYVFGMERDNYYYINENSFIWIATFEDNRDLFLKNAVKIF